MYCTMTMKNLNDNNNNNNNNDPFSKDYCLPSYTRIRQRTLDTLYHLPSTDANNNNSNNTYYDKSPKGSVDKPIQHVVDLLNFFSVTADDENNDNNNDNDDNQTTTTTTTTTSKTMYPFSTLSSCSGRIVVFEHSNNNTNNNANNNTYNNTSSLALSSTSALSLEENNKKNNNNNSIAEVIANTKMSHRPNTIQKEHKNNNDNNTMQQNDYSELYDNEDDDDDTTKNIDSTTSTTTATTKKDKFKKGGQWLLISHTMIQINDIENIFFHCNSSNNSCIDNKDDILQTKTTNTNNTNIITTNCTIKFEPALLHIACCNIYYANILLQIALQCGYRESGMIYTSSTTKNNSTTARITVAIRSNSLQLSIPFTRQQQQKENVNKDQSCTISSSTSTSSTSSSLLLLPPSRQYLQSLAINCNERLQRNWDKIQRLYNAIILQQASKSSSRSMPTTIAPMLYTQQQQQQSTVKFNPTSNQEEEEEQTYSQQLATTSGNQDTTTIYPIIQIEETQYHSTDSIPGLTSTKIPDLNLWGHAMVEVNEDYNSVTSNNDSSNDDTVVTTTLSSLLVFGGYGIGPICSIDKNDNTTDTTNAQYQNATTKKHQQQQQQRSKHVYRLGRSINHEMYNWNDQWERIQCDNQYHHSIEKEKQERNVTLFFNTIPVVDVTEQWTAREGHTATYITNTDIVVIFGGRTNPITPLNELYFYNITTNKFYIPTNYNTNNNKPRTTTTTIPSPRWGHTMTLVGQSTTVSSTDNNDDTKQIDLILCGGRNESNVVHDSLYVLSIIIPISKVSTTNEIPMTEGHIIWQKISLTDNIPSLLRFHHSAVSIDNNTIMILGGLQYCNDNLLEAFASEETNDNHPVVPLIIHRIHTAPIQSSCDGITNCIQHQMKYQYVVRNVVTPGTSTGISICPRFGHTTIFIPTFGSTLKIGIMGSILCIGGIPSSMEDNCNNDTTSTGSQDGIIISILVQRIGLGLVSTTGNSVTLSQTSNIPIWKLILQECQFHPSVRTVDIGPLVHHNCILLHHERNDHKKEDTTNAATCNTFYLCSIGGGLAGFSFGPNFAKSCSFTISMLQGNNLVIDTPTQSKHNVSVPATSSTNTSINNGHLLSSSKHTTNNSTTKNDCRTSSNKKDEVDVLYVHPNDAKEVKTMLEKLGLIHTIYRMTKINPKDENCFIQNEQDTCTAATEISCTTSTMIAIPVTSQGMAQIQLLCCHNNNNNNNNNEIYTNNNSDKDTTEIVHHNIGKIFSDSYNDTGFSLLKTKIIGWGRKALPYRTGIFASYKKL